MSDDEALWCRLCDEERPGDSLFCPVHRSEELVPRPPETHTGSPGREPADEELAAPRPVCWRCGARLNAQNDTCAECHAPAAPPTLLVEFPDGTVMLPALRTSVLLGRAGEHGRLFARYPNVSRRHATLEVDAAGDAWINPEYDAPNGTFINDEEIVTRSRLQPGDRIRFATGRGIPAGPVSGPVRQPHREPVNNPD